MLSSALPAFGAEYSGTAHEGFDYTAGAMSNTFTGGTGWNASGDNSANTTTWGVTLPAGTAFNLGTAANQTITGSSLAYPGYPTGTGASVLIAGPGQAGRNLGQTVDSGTFYFSFLVKKTIDQVRTINLSFFGSTGESTAPTERFAIGQIANNTNLRLPDGSPDPAAATKANQGHFAVLVNGPQGGVGTVGVYTSASPTSFAVGTTFLVVGKVEFNVSGAADRLTVYINPASLGEEGATAPYIQLDNIDFGALLGFRFFAGGVSGAFNPSAAEFDEIRLGRTYVAVTGGGPSDPNGPVVFNVQPQPATGFVGQTITLGSFASGVPTYQWQKSTNGGTIWNNIPGATSANYSLSPAVYADTALYRVVGTNTSGSVNSNAVQVTLAYPPPTVTQRPYNTTLVAGTDVNLTVVATGVGTLAYQWSKDSSPIGGATSATYPLPAITATANGTYSLVITDPAATADGLPATTTTVTFTVTVIDASAATVAYYRFEDGSDGATIGTATDSTSGANVMNGSGTPTYSVIVPGTTVPRTAAANTLAANFPTGNNALAASTSGALASTTFSDFTIEAYVRYTALGGFQTIIGRDDAGNPGEGGGPQSLLYFQKNGGDQFRVEVITATNTNLQVNTTFVPVLNTWYHVAAVGNALTGTLTFYIDGVQQGASTSGFTGLFIPSPGSDTPWTIGRGEFNDGATDYSRSLIDEVRISKVALSPTQFLHGNLSGIASPAISSGVASQTVRSGTDVTLSVSATAAGGGTTLTYQWYKNDVPISGATASTLPLTNVQASSDATYSVIVSDTAGTPPPTSTSRGVLHVVDAPLPGRAISLNFVGASSGGNFSTALGSFAAGEATGFLPVANWVNSATVNSVASSLAPLALVENTGASSPATATWSSGNTWASLAINGAPSAKTANLRLLHGYIESRADIGTTVTLGNIPYASYDVYVYFAGGTANNVGRATTSATGSPTYYYKLVASDSYNSTALTAGPYPFMLSDETSMLDAQLAPAAHFVRFAGLADPELTVTVADAVLNANAGGIAAVSIVDRTPAGTPYPPTVTTAPVSQLKTGGSSTTLTVAATSNNSGGVLSYQWQKDNVNIGGQTGSSLVLNSLTGPATGTYSVVITDTSSLGAISTTRSATLIVVDPTRPLLINGDINATTTPTFAGNGILRPTGLNHIGSELGGNPSTVIWNSVLGATGTATRTLSKESTGLSLPGVSFTYAGAQGVEDNTAAGFISSSAALALSRDYLYTDNQTTPLTASIGGLDALVGKKVTLLVYAYGKLSTAFFEAVTSDTATVTLASANNHLGTTPKATTTISEPAAGRNLQDNNLDSTAGVSAAYVSFDGVVAPDGTVSWSVGADTDGGRIPLVGFQLLVTGEDIAPPAPTNLAAVGGDDQVALTWTASSGASTYTIRRSTTSGGPYTTISAGAVSVTNYTDTTAVNGTTYYYVVAAANALAVSANSNQASTTPASSTTALQNWRFTHFGNTANTGNGANTADPDGDGMINLLEYALGTIPTTAGVSPVVLGQSGGALTLTFSPVVDANLTYVVEASSNLAGAWETAHNYGAFASTTPVTYTDSIVVNGSNPRRFLRLRVTTSE